jgi:hypothetical protein
MARMKHQELLRSYSPAHLASRVERRALRPVDDSRLHSQSRHPLPDAACVGAQRLSQIAARTFRPHVSALLSRDGVWPRSQQNRQNPGSGVDRPGAKAAFKTEISVQHAKLRGRLLGISSWAPDEGVPQSELLISGLRRANIGPDRFDFLFLRMPYQDGILSLPLMTESTNRSCSSGRRRRRSNAGPPHKREVLRHDSLHTGHGRDRPVSAKLCGYVGAGTANANTITMPNPRPKDLAKP